jgi:hypothetical protein
LNQAGSNDFNRVHGDFKIARAAAEGLLNVPAGRFHELTPCPPQTAVRFHAETPWRRNRDAKTGGNGQILPCKIRVLHFSKPSGDPQT